MKKITDRTDFNLGTTGQITVMAHALDTIEDISMMEGCEDLDALFEKLVDIEQLCSAVHVHLSRIKEDYRIASREQMIAMNEDWTDKHDNDQFDLLKDLEVERG
jgi:hypothetical protein